MQSHPHNLVRLHKASFDRAQQKNSPGVQAGSLPAIEQLFASGFHELLGQAPGDEPAALALALSLAAHVENPSSKRLCFCSLGADIQERGQLYGFWLASLGIDPRRLVMLSAPREKDLLWLLEEAVASGAFGGVIGWLGGREHHYNFALSRRLKLRNATKNVPLFLIRHCSGQGATAANSRWRVSALPSRIEGARGNFSFLGQPRLCLTLEKMAGLLPQSMEMEYNVSRGFHLVSPLANGPHRTPEAKSSRAA